MEAQDDALPGTAGGGRVRPGRPQAAQAVWSWKEGPSRGSDPSRASIRARGSLQAALLGAVAAATAQFVSVHGGIIIGCVAGVVLLSALLSPLGVLAALDRAVATLGRLLSRLVAFIALPLVYYGVFLPLGAVLRRSRRDAMKRFFEPESKTYWTERDTLTTASSDRSRQY